MSGPEVTRVYDDPVLDAGVLEPGPLVEIGGWSAVARQGGTAVLPWRQCHLAATAAGVLAQASTVGLPPVRQIVVRVGKGRAANEADIAAAWNLLEPEAILLVAGANALGAGPTIARLAAAVDQPAVLVAQRARQRVARFRRRGPALPAPAPGLTALAAGDARLLRVDPGVFSPDAIDPATALLQQHLGVIPARVADLGCGAGHLGLWAALSAPDCTVLLADADARAVRCAEDNAQALGLGARTTTLWWSAEEPLPAQVDLVLCNPPAHAGAADSTQAAVAMFRSAVAALAPGGRMLLVANRHLPYERPLSYLGRVNPVADDGRFKVLELIP